MKRMENRQCFYCYRYSWDVAKGRPCPHCYCPQPRFRIKETHVLVAVAVASIISATYVLLNV